MIAVSRWRRVAMAADLVSRGMRPTLEGRDTRPTAMAAERKVTTLDVRRRKGKEKLAVVTAYDATFARMFDEAGVDILLVGDSLGMVVQGATNTLGVTMDEMAYHVRAVARGTTHAHVVVDMPFLAANLTPQEALRNAGRLIAAGAHAVKIEGGQPVVPAIQHIVAAGIPVMGHLGLTPQSVHAMGGFRVQGKTPEEAERLCTDAAALQEAGVYAMVLEGIPPELAAEVTRRCAVPTFGIGAGPECDGQVLVGYDLLGLTSGTTPKFVKRYDEFFSRGVRAARRYAEEVRGSAFPAAEHTYTPS